MKQTQRQRIEHSEQAKVVARVRAFYPGVIIAAIPNGAARSASERLNLYGEGLLSGMPDLCVLRPSCGFHGLFIEMKTLEGRMSEAQRDIQRRLIKEGYVAVTCRGADDAWATIQEYLDGDRKVG